MAGEQPLSQAEILQKLERVGNLESVVTEQRMRMEKLKTTYEMLKAEHIQLQEVCVVNCNNGEISKIKQDATSNSKERVLQNKGLPFFWRCILQSECRHKTELFSNGEEDWKRKEILSGTIKLIINC